VASGTFALQQLHINQPRPITDPAPALLTHASNAAQGPAHKPQARRSAGRRGGPVSSDTVPLAVQDNQHLQGGIWAPDTYSLGPAPAALAAADDAAVIVDSLISNPHSLRQTHLVSCLETMLTLTKLAGAMSKEAAGEGGGVQSTRTA
jgi:hypothetical protein